MSSKYKIKRRRYEPINKLVRDMDKEVVVDGNLITSRNPYDLPGFCREIVRKFKP